MISDRSHNNTIEGELCNVSYTSFGRSDPQIRQFCLFTLPDKENLHSSETTMRFKYPALSLSSLRQF